MMKKLILFVGVLCLIIGIFFGRVFWERKIPVPVDALVGLYHPWRDYFASDFPRGVPFRNFLITDPVRQQIVWRKNAVDSWKEGRVPLWNPYEFSGSPLLGNSQAGSLYPFNTIFWMFDYRTSWTLFIVLQPFLAMTFFYAFARSMGFSRFISLTGACMWALSGSQVSWFTWGTIGHVSAWIPLALLSVRKLLLIELMITSHFVWGWLFFCAIFLMTTAGHLQIAGYGIALTISYGYYLLFSRSSRASVFRYTIFAFGTLAVTGLAILPQLAHFSQSTRLPDAITLPDGWLIPIYHAIQFVIPDFFGNPATLNYWGIWNYGEMASYIGAVGAAFFIVGTIRVWKSRNFWLLAVVFCWVLFLDTPFTRWLYWLDLPLWDSMQPTRLLIIDGFCAVVIAMAGLQGFVRQKRIGSAFITSVVLVIALLLVWTVTRVPAFLPFLKPADAAVAGRNTMYSLAMQVLVLLAIITSIILQRVRLPIVGSALSVRRSQMVLVGGLLFLIVLVDAYRYFWKFTPASEVQHFFPVTEAVQYLQEHVSGARIMTDDDMLFPPNTLGYFGLRTIDGYDSFVSDRYIAYMAALNKGEPNISRPFGFNRIVRANRPQSPLVPHLNVTYLVSFKKLSEQYLTQVYSEGQTKIYRDARAVGQAYLVEDVRVRQSDEAILREMHADDFSIGRSAVVSHTLPDVSGVFGIDDTVEVVSVGNDELLVRVTSNVSRLLVTSLVSAPGWKVRIDGEPHEVIVSNFLFMGVVVPSGIHVVEFRYRP